MRVRVKQVCEWERVGAYVYLNGIFLQNEKVISCPELVLSTRKKCFEHQALCKFYRFISVFLFTIKDYNIKCLKCVLVGIVDTSKYDIRTLKTKLPEVKFLPLYCMVETGCIAATRVKDYTMALNKPSDAVGILTLNCKIKIVHFKTKELCCSNVYGEVFFNGDGLMLG